jgi:hypothetical protein
MRHLLILPLMIAATPALADGSNLGPDREVIELGGIVPALCKIGNAQSDDRQFDVGILTDRTTGFLKRGLSAPTQRLQGSFCNSASQLTVEAVPLTPVGTNGPAPAGFSRGVHFTATVSGWTDEPATFRTSLAADQPSAIQRQPRPREADILVDVTQFETNGGSGLRPVASLRYEGAVIVTLGPTP